MSVELIVRLIGLLVFGTVGAFLGESVGTLVSEFWTNNTIPTLVYQIVTTILIGALGFLITPWISIKPISAIRKHLSKVSAQTLFLVSWA